MQYKSAECYYDLQSICDDFEVEKIRVYGIKGHGKNEVDAVGGVVKNAIRRAVKSGDIFTTASDCTEFSERKFAHETAPEYVTEDMAEEALKDLIRRKSVYIL